MAITTSGTSITFNDATVQTTAFSGTGVLSAIASGTTAGAVGTYTVAWNTGGNISRGANVAGSQLRAGTGGAQRNPYGFVSNPTTNSVTLSGTWYSIVFCPAWADNGDDPNSYFPGLFVRVS